ncbi:MAG: hypothetical protein ACRD3F_02210 [Acidobacteriaceae bacterium]
MSDEKKAAKSATPAKPRRPRGRSRLITYVIGKYKEHKAKRESENPTDKAARRTAVATIWIGIFTATLAGVAYLQYQDSHILTKISVLNTRAWINVVGTGFGYTTEDHHASGRIVLANSGPTPASNVRAWRCSEIRNTEPVIGDIPPPNDPNCIPDTFGTIGKGGTVTINGFDSTRIVAEGSLNPNGHTPGNHFYFWGKITYGIFTKDGTHFTDFCLLNAENQLAPCVSGHDANWENCQNPN